MKTFLLSLFVAVAPAAIGNSATLQVFAAASLTDALKEIAALYHNEREDRVRFNFGASSMLARQIEEGAPADLFFSADEAKMDALQRKELIVTGTRRSPLGNSLVIVLASDSRQKIESASDLTKAELRRIALADPKTVPAGIYAKEYLVKMNLWRSVEDKIVPTDNVRAALAAVESGNVEAAIVYKTDASISKKVKVACQIPESEGPRISYSMAVLKESKQLAAARQFLEYLSSEKASRVFEKHGFIIRK